MHQIVGGKRLTSEVILDMCVNMQSVCDRRSNSVRLVVCQERLTHTCGGQKRPSRERVTVQALWAVKNARDAVFLRRAMQSDR